MENIKELSHKRMIWSYMLSNPEEDSKGNKGEAMLKKITAENFPKIQKTKWVPRNKNKFILRLIKTGDH